MEKDDFKEIDLTSEKKKLIREISKVDVNEITDYSKTYNKPIEDKVDDIVKEENKLPPETFWVKLTKIFK